MPHAYSLAHSINVTVTKQRQRYLPTIEVDLNQTLIRRLKINPEVKASGLIGNQMAEMMMNAHTPCSPPPCHFLFGVTHTIDRLLHILLYGLHSWQAKTSEVRERCMIIQIGTR